MTQQIKTLLPTREPFLRRHSTLLILLAILLAATFFRFNGREFDSGTNQHPDERTVASRVLNIRWPADTNELFDPLRSPMNLRAAGMEGNCPSTPCEYPYGSLPVYLTKLAGWALDAITPADSPQKGFLNQNFYGVTVMGRHLASVFDLITILLVFLIARRLYSRGTALIAAALVAFSVTHIQLAHFTTVDTFLATFMIGALYFSVVLMQRPSWWAAVGAGACIGMAVASKVSVLPFALIVVAAIVLRALYRTRTRKLGAEFGDPVGVKPAPAQERALSFSGHLLRGLRYPVLALIFSVLAFAITEPYVLWQFNWSLLGDALTGRGATLEDFFRSNTWGTRILSEAAVQSGQVDIVYTRQYVGTAPLLYHLQNMVFWGLGPIPGVITVIGFVVGMWYAVKRKPAEVLFMAGALPYFVSILTLEAKWMRYMLPLVPIFCILGAALLVRGAIWGRARFALPATGRRAPILVLQRNLFPILASISVGGAFLWAVAFSNIYSQEHSRLLASRWFYENIPTGLARSEEGWDDTLPLGIPPNNGRIGGNGNEYGLVRFDIYNDAPPEQKFEYLKEKMAQTDVIILASNRLYGSVSKLPWRYPVDIEFYKLLFAGKLGYELVHTEHVTPELLGMRFDDQSADESFTVYDHPRVDIFRKVANLTDEQLRTLFSTALNRPMMEYSTLRHDKLTDDKSLQVSEMINGQAVNQLPDLGDYAWNPLAQEDTQWIAVLLWLLAVYVIGFAALPILFTVGRNLPDRAYPLAKIGGIILVSWGTWMAASARVLPFTFWSIGFMLLLMAGLSAVLWRLGAGRDIRAFFREKGKLVIFYEATFLLAFAAFLWLRLQNPDIWHPWQGGEKPMEVGMLNSVLRSAWMPPLDPFFAGGYVNYYYHGYFVIACIVKLTGTLPALAFNLAIPLLFALTFSAASSLVYNIVAWIQSRRGSLSRVSRAGMAFGLLGSVLMLAIGNMQGFFQWLTITFPSFAPTLVSWVQNFGYKAKIFTVFEYWNPPSRVIQEGTTINEFPYWTFLFADLHPHLINMPVTLLAAGLGLNLALSGRPRKLLAMALTAGALPPRHALRLRVMASLQWLWGEGWSGALRFGVMTLCLGALIVINSWDFPTYLALAGGAALVAMLLAFKTTEDEEPALSLPKGRRTEDGGITEGSDHSALSSQHSALDKLVLYGTTVLSIGVLAGVALLSYLPFFLNFKAFYTDIVPIVDGANTGGFVTNRTPLVEFLVVWAIFIFITLSYLVMRLWQFPWTAAISGVTRLIPTPAPRATQGAVPQRAFERRLALRQSRERGLTLAPAGASPAGTTSSIAAPLEGVMPFSSEVGEAESRVGEQEHSGNGSPFGRGSRTGEQGVAGDWLALPVDSTPIDEDTPIPHKVAEPDDLPHWADLDREPGADGNYAALSPYRAPEAEEIAVQAPAREEVAVRALPAQPGVIPLWAGVGLLGVTAAIVALQIATGQFLLALLILLIGGIIATTLATSRSAGTLFTSALLVGALAVAMGVELVYLADHLRGGPTYRMNTVFKFYMQVWTLFALGGAVAIYHILYGLREERARRKVVVGTESEVLQATEPLASHTPGASNGHLMPNENGSENSSGWAGRDLTAPTPNRSTANWLVWATTTPLSESQVEETEGSTEPISVPLTATSPREKTSRMVGTTAEVEEKPALRWTIGRLAWLAVFSLFMFAALTFTFGGGTQGRIADRNAFAIRPPVGSLNGMNYMKTATFSTDVSPLPIEMKQDYEAINWLNKNVSGAGTLAEWHYGYYREFGMRAASLTGHPMVVGGLHQDEQRAGVYARLVYDRHSDMTTFFTTPDIQKALVILSKYDVDYVYMGQLEQGSARSGLAKFRQMADPKVGILREVFRSEGSYEDAPDTVIYEVARSREKSPETITGAPVEGSGIPGISITPVPTAIPTPLPTPPTDDPELKVLIDATVAEPTNREKRIILVDWYRTHQYFNDAARELETMVRQAPQEVNLRHQLGDAYQAAGQLDKALAAWEAGRDINPNDAPAHNKVGIAYLDRKRYDDAIREFEETVRLDAAFNEAWFHMGEAYAAKGDRDNARRAFQSAIDKGPPNSNGWADSARERLKSIR